MTIGLYGWAGAQEFPTQRIELYVGYAAGGATDVLARAVANLGSKYVGQQIVPVNKPGASGTIASAAVATSKADGYTLLMGGGSETTSAGHFQKLPFHPINDFETVIRFIRLPIVINVAAESPWKTIQEMIAAVKAAPGKYSYASSGIGSHYHAAMLVLEKQAGISFRHVPFKGGAENLAALIGGHVDIAISSPDEAFAIIEGKKVRPLAHFSDTPTPMLPQTPSLRMVGYDAYVENMKGIMAPKNTPKPVVQKLHDSLRKLFDDKEFKATLAKLKMEEAYLNSEGFGKAIRAMYEQIGNSLKK
jgi:tripartite-type tricarboxylate transporter receptor subunit TctC